MNLEEIKRFLETSLKFGTLEEAECAIREIHALYMRCMELNDKKGSELCRKRILDGKKRTKLISRNRRVSLMKRQQKEEMHLWFSLWLDNPSTFFQWLKLRKKTESYKSLARGEYAV